MRIGELSARAGVTPRTVRHYEELGLISARRAANGYREYGDTDLRLLEEVRSLIDLGFTLDETRPFLDCLRAGHSSAGVCAASLAGYRRKLAEIDGYLSRLTAMRTQLLAEYESAVPAAQSLILLPEEIHDAQC